MPCAFRGETGWLSESALPLTRKMQENRPDSVCQRSKNGDFSRYTGILAKCLRASALGGSSVVAILTETQILNLLLVIGVAVYLLFATN